jgi:hypothetical protein
MKANVYLKSVDDVEWKALVKKIEEIQKSDPFGEKETVEL